MKQEQNCPECGAEELKYGLVHTMWSTMNQIATAVVGVLGLVATFTVDSAILRLIGLLVAGIVAWGFFRGWNKELTSVKFKCVECKNTWDVKVKGSNPDNTGKQIPPTEWRTLSSHSELPELED